jgi:sodium/potassium-transporting ATPase subunit alpha
MEKDEKSVPRVRYADEEEGNVGHPHDGQRVRRLSRSSSHGSLSIRNTERTIQPETALPITYRTLSIEIDEGQQKKQEATKKAKDKAAVGKPFQCTEAQVMAFLIRIS